MPEGSEPAEDDASALDDDVMEPPESEGSSEVPLQAHPSNEAAMAASPSNGATPMLRRVPSGVGVLDTFARLVGRSAALAANITSGLDDGALRRLVRQACSPLRFDAAACNNAIVTRSALEPPQPGVRRRLSLNPPGLFPFTLWRLSDPEVALLGDFLAPIKDTYAFDLAMEQRPCALPTTFLAAEYIFGRTSRMFDEYKGSFRFPLLLLARRRDLLLRYLCLVRDHRGTVGVRVYRYQEQRRSDDYFVPPVENEASETEIATLARSVLEFLDLSGTSLASSAPSFYRTVRSDIIVYGVRSGELFVRCPDTREEYEQILEEVAADIGPDQAQRQQDDIQTLFEDISRGEFHQR